MAEGSYAGSAAGQREKGKRAADPGSTPEWRRFSRQEERAREQPCRLQAGWSRNQGKEGRQMA